MNHYLSFLLALGLIASACATYTDEIRGGPVLDDDDDDDDDDQDPGDDDGQGDDDSGPFDCATAWGPPYEEWEWGGECPSLECQGNTAPVLAEPIFCINGEVGALESIQSGDIVQVFIAFEDAECNLRCGTGYDSYQTPDYESGGGGSLPTNLSCSTAEIGWHMGFYFDVNATGSYGWGLSVVDYCGAESSSVAGGFQVL
jgi:hypothetical protein